MVGVHRGLGVGLSHHVDGETEEWREVKCLYTCESKVAETGEESVRPSDSLFTLFSPPYVLQIPVYQLGVF